MTGQRPKLKAARQAGVKRVWQKPGAPWMYMEVEKRPKRRPWTWAQWRDGFFGPVLVLGLIAAALVVFVVLLK